LRPWQDSNLRTRLRRGLLCRALTSGNEFTYTLSGGLSGRLAGPALLGTLSAGIRERGGALTSGCCACGISPDAAGTCEQRGWSCFAAFITAAPC
jgi:hypothetical protein